MAIELTTQLLAGEAGDGATVLVLMHGRGADASDLAALRPWLPASMALLLPQAPHPGAPWGYGPGWAWYRYEGEDRPDAATFSASQESLEQQLGALDATLGFRPGPVVLGGFSQGGAMALGYALSHPADVVAVMNFSGFVPAHPTVTVSPATVAGTAFFWGHGTADPAIPLSLARRGRDALRAAGADLEARDYAMGHGIQPAEIRDAVAWLERRLSG